MLTLTLCGLVGLTVPLDAAGAKSKTIGAPNFEKGEFRPDRWAFARDWEEMRLAQAGSYGDALRFAECVRRFDPGIAAEVMARPLADPAQRTDLVRIAQQYRGCGMRVAVPAMLVRAAFAEVGLRGATGMGAPGSVGVPAQIRDFPVAALAGCQLQEAPALAMALLATRPGGSEEEAAAQRLVEQTPRCGALARGSITPTAARLAVIQAAAMQRR
ncbi:hypothetical protein GCM10022280_19300 [Sphingomonas swuensis]|uniref:Lytic transglycosylase domain-containing protein n=1 Tax=Sphingomonas swuensis TaxID=977800 RepID=A0ABP7T1N4_9SPHN